LKSNQKIIQLFLLFLFLLATTLQSFDAIHHFKEESKVVKCHHKYNNNATEISHAHHQIEHCKICDFTFSTVTYTSVLKYNFYKPTVHQQYTFFHSKDITQFFRGSLFSLRAPPIFIA
jgi:hypothetical protein